MKEQIEQTARVCHEANRAYCETIGDFSQPKWEDLATGKKPAPSASHESWLAQKREEGWTYGPTKDAENKTHPCFMPYDGLPVDQRLKDYIFAAIVEAFWTASQLGVAA